MGSTVQAATVLPPGCVLSRELACIQMGLITTTFHEKIGTFEYVCERLWPSCVNLATQQARLVLPQCAEVSRDIRQPCAVAPFSFNAAGICGFPHLYWGVASDGLSWSLTVYCGSLLFSVWSVAVFTAVN